MRAACFWLFLLCGLFTLGCGVISLYPPVAFLEQLAPIYPEARPQNCKLIVLTSPPTEPYEVFAQIVAYAGSADMAEKIEVLIKTNACEAGADAIVLLPMQSGTHISTRDMYPDWIVGNTPEQGGDRFQRSDNRRYTVSQRAVAIVFTKGSNTAQKRSNL
jgi:hypothetical protein